MHIQTEMSHLFLNMCPSAHGPSHIQAESTKDYIEMGNLVNFSAHGDMSFGSSLLQDHARSVEE